MKIVLTLLIVLALGVLALQAYVRLAPTDPAIWHVDPGLAGAGEATETLPGGVRVARGFGAPPADLLAQIDRIAQKTPRTKPIAGSVEEGMITYETRSALWGFPDYTTVAAQPGPDGGSSLRIYARLRFGGSDMGVNAARVENWLSELE